MPTYAGNDKTRQWSSGNSLQNIAILCTKADTFINIRIIGAFTADTGVAYGTMVVTKRANLLSTSL